MSTLLIENLDKFLPIKKRKVIEMRIILTIIVIYIDIFDTFICIQKKG